MWIGATIGAIIGAIVGVVFYVLRNGGAFLKRDSQVGFGFVVVQAIAHMIIPVLVGIVIGALLFLFSN